MYTPFANLTTRIVEKDHYLGKIPMKVGVQVAVKIITNQFRESNWKDPMTFDPERWNNVQPGKEPPFSFFPFSAGHRVCIGQHLAVLEAKIALIGVLKAFPSISIEKP